MRLALAIASFVVLIVHGVVFHDQFFHRWERHQTAYFEQARTHGQERRASEAELEDAHAAASSRSSSRSFGETRVDRCTTCHIAADDPRFARPRRAAEDPSLFRRHGRRPAQRPLGAPPQVHRFRLHRLPRRPGPRPGDRSTATARTSSGPSRCSGYVTQANWRKDFAPKLKGKEYMEANCAQCHTDENFAGTPHVNRGRKLFYAMNCYGCHKIDGMSRRHARPRSDRGRQEVQDRLPVGVDRRAARQPGHLLHAQVPPERRRREGAGDLPEEPARREFRRNRRSTATKPHVANVAVRSIPPGNRPAEKVAGEQLIADRACTACHKLERQGRRHRARPQLRRPASATTTGWSTTSRTRARACPIPSCRRSASRTTISSASPPIWQPKTPPPRHGAAETFKALCARCHGEKGDGNGKVAWYLDPSPRDFTKAGFMNTKPRERFVDSIKEGVPGPPCRLGQGPERRADRRRARLRLDQTFTKEPARAQEAAQSAGRRTRWPIDAGIHRARRADLPGALHRLPRAQGRRQGTQLARHHAAPAQPAQQLVRRQR